MAREAKQVISRPVWYHPECDREDKSPTAFRVLLKPLSARELKGLLKDDLEDRDVFADRVQRVENYSIPHRATGERIQPATGAELWDAIMEHGDPDEAKILAEVRNALISRSKLDAGLREPSSSQSASPSLGTQRGDGAAGGAAAQSNGVKHPSGSDVPLADAMRS